MFKLKFSTIYFQYSYTTATSDIQILHTNGTPFTSVSYISKKGRSNDCR